MLLFTKSFNKYSISNNCNIYKFSSLSRSDGIIELPKLHKCTLMKLLCIWALQILFLLYLIKLTVGCLIQMVRKIEKGILQHSHTFCVLYAAWSLMKNRKMSWCDRFSLSWTFEKSRIRLKKKDTKDYYFKLYW